MRTLLLLCLLSLLLASARAFTRASFPWQCRELFVGGLSLGPGTPRRVVTTRLLTAGSARSLRPMITKLEATGLLRETLAGTVTALATIPTSVAYAAVVGVSPLVGIWSSAVVGFFSAVVGREPGMISAAAGVIAIPMAAVYKLHGETYMLATLFLAGTMELLFGALKLGTRIGLYCEDTCDLYEGSYITPPIIAGFMNAFGLFLVKSQYKLFRSLEPTTLPASLATALATVVGIHLFPRVITGIPGSLMGLLFASVVSLGLKFPLLLLSEYAGPGVFTGGLSALPSLKTSLGLFSGNKEVLDVLLVALPAAFGVALISILETAIAAEIAGKNFVKSAEPAAASSYLPHGNRAMIGLGVGNIASAFLGGFGGCGVIPNTQLNSRSGGIGLASSIAYSLALAVAVVFAAPMIGRLPMAALGGLMIQVAWNTIEWKENLELIKKGLKNATASVDLLALLVTTVVCIKKDMGLGVLSGVVVTKVGHLAIAHLGPRLQGKGALA